MHAVFFSLISEEKGAEIVLEAAKALPEVTFDFYGRIDDDFGNVFLSEVHQSNNVVYQGVFDSVSGDVLRELNKFDIHLFPTLCPHEGVPGVIAETKLAAVPTVASDRGYNAELIENGVDGILMYEDSADELVCAIRDLVQNPGRLDEMKLSALSSSERFCVDRYIDLIVDDLPEEAVL